MVPSFFCKNFRFSINSLNYKKNAGFSYISSAIFVMLWAMDSKPHSIFTLSFPRRRNLRNDQQPLILPKVCSTSTTLLERSSRPFLEQRLSFACFFNSFNRCDICMVRGFSDFLHISACGQSLNPQPVIVPDRFISCFCYIVAGFHMLHLSSFGPDVFVVFFIVSEMF